MRMRSYVDTRFHLGSIAVATLAVAIGRPAEAAACTARPDGNDHYYAVVEAYNMANEANEGAGVDLLTNNLNADSSDFVSHEMWYGVTGDASYWVEVGVMAGMANGVFWADNRNGGGYNEHFYDVESDQANGVVVAATSVACTWRWPSTITFSAPRPRTARGPPARSLRELESTSAGSVAHVDGRMQGWIVSNTGLFSNWSPAAFYATCPADIKFTDSTHVQTEEELHGPF